MQTIRARRTKKYRPRPVLQFGGLSILRGRQQVEPAEQTEFSVSYWLAFDAMVKGMHSTEEQWMLIAVTLNVALILAERGLGAEFVPYVVSALDGMFRSHQRATKHNVWRFDGEAIHAVRTALEIIDEQLALATQDQIRDALREADKRAVEGHIYKVAA